MQKKKSWRPWSCIPSTRYLNPWWWSECPSSYWTHWLRLCLAVGRSENQRGIINPSPLEGESFFSYFNQKKLGGPGGPGGAALLPGSDASLTTTSLLLKQSLRPPVQGRNSHCHALIWNLQFHTRKIQESVNVLIKIVGLHNLVQFLGGTQVTATGSLIVVVLPCCLVHYWFFYYYIFNFCNLKH